MVSKKKIVLLLTIILIVGIFTGFLWNNFIAERQDNLTSYNLSEIENGSGSEAFATIIANNLVIPWSINFLPDGSIIFTERPGRIQMIDVEQGQLQKPLLTIDEVAHSGEGGLLGITLHPDFSDNHWVYVYYTYEDGENTANKVVRFEKNKRNLVNKTTIIDDIPGSFIHNGGRIKFGPDGYLYITTGDSANGELAQNKNSLAGKILRLEDDGSVPKNNPFPDSPIYSLGHRNPQGLAWDKQDRLWSTEHGSSATDELNLIKPGNNYGWPVIQGDETSTGLENPVIHSGSQTWAPSGAAYLNGSVYFAGLRSQSLYEAEIGDNKSIDLKRHLKRKFGRLRGVVVGPDDFLYIFTSNRDGRGVPTENDDQIIRINPKNLSTSTDNN
ncbi:Quinoprotein glucose dehydrogenase [Methanohalobium evestigatum Z-7303]|uniref:Quinoprotein glucose dehydrogenase n=1 Tax=Methanohalobium evestigatum (strain ATCC BAA-1072 / DSM 3721 / NBRC 107634 / OCM 161 / Z-7303) TaxID=644295 RepID=D7EA84_METEZ|nr:PQQ-dependent sugar dehydrogenase [Methanohalobium evestigatum]ADI74755.1 Quinoprotein glucose dehydrogenase [Methanohalobium evestigatum Z-7303]